MRMALQALERADHIDTDMAAAADALRAEINVRDQMERPVAEPLKGWKLNHVQSVLGSGTAEIGYRDPESEQFAPLITVDTGLYYQSNQAAPLANAVLKALLSAPNPELAVEQAKPAASAEVRLLGDDLLATIAVDGAEFEVKWEEERHEEAHYQFGHLPAASERWVTAVRLSGAWFDRSIFGCEFCDRLDAALAKALEPKA